MIFIDYYFHMACVYSQWSAKLDVHGYPRLSKFCKNKSKRYYKLAGWA